MSSNNGEHDRPPNPVIISVSHNDMMEGWDVELIVGNFGSEEEARQAAMDIGRLLEDIYGATFRAPTNTNETLQ